MFCRCLRKIFNVVCQGGIGGQRSINALSGARGICEGEASAPNNNSSDTLRCNGGQACQKMRGHLNMQVLALCAGEQSLPGHPKAQGIIPKSQPNGISVSNSELKAELISRRETCPGPRLPWAVPGHYPLHAAGLTTSQRGASGSWCPQPKHPPVVSH